MQVEYWHTVRAPFGELVFPVPGERDLHPIWVHRPSLVKSRRPGSGTARKEVKAKIGQHTHKYCICSFTGF